MLSSNSKLKIIFLAGFLMALHLALTAYVNSSFLVSFLSEQYVGLVFTSASFASILALLLVPGLLRFLGGFRLILWSVGLSALSLLMLAIYPRVHIIIPVFIFYFALNNIIIFILDEFLEIFSEGRAIGKIRGFYLAFLSSAWVLAQIILSRTSASFNFSSLYFYAFLLIAILFLLSLFCFRNFGDPNYDKMPISKSLISFFRNKGLTRIYILNFMLQFFFSWMVIYTPIYLNTRLGFSWSEIGAVFTVMLLPFVILPFGLGRYSDKIGERKMLIFGFMVTGFSTALLFFMQTTSLWLWAFALFFTRVGASTIETMSDIYFFKHINKEEDEFVGIYRNTSSIAYIIGPLLASVVLFVAPTFNFIFLVLGIFMFSGSLLASQIKSDDI